MRKLTENQQQVLTSLKNAEVKGIVINNKTRLMRVIDVQTAVKQQFGRSCTTSALRHTLARLEDMNKVRVAKVKVGGHSTLNLYAAK